MGEMPRKVNDVKQMCHAVIIGYAENPTIFLHGDSPGVQLVYMALNTASDKKAAALAAYRAAVKEEVAANQAAIKKLQVEKKQAEVDTAANPENMRLIGMSPPSPPTPIAPPGEPRDLTAFPQGTTSVKLKWRVPAKTSGGRVRDYRVERREGTTGTAFTEWHEIANTFDKNIILRDQPRATQLEFRVVAQNIAGENPSRAVDVVL